MHISWEDFKRNIEEFTTLSDEINDNWILHKSEELHQSYLTKKKVIEVESLVITIEYHIAYSISYSTPILCLNCWRQDGTLLSMEDCWKILNFDDSDDMYSTLTQLDHPVLLRPFLTLHPCKTAELLQRMFLSSKNLVVSWLSAIGPSVKLDVDLAYARLT
nr:ubiquitin-like-conjugating enzyme ATG10 [Onthophagus taurus]